MSHSRWTLQTINKKLFFILWISCLIGALSVLPYIVYLRLIPSTVSLWTLSLLSLAQAAILYGLVLWISYLILPKTDLQPFSASQPWSRIIVPGLVYGVLTGLVIVVFEHFVFRRSILSSMHPPRWAGALASLYGAINEEVLMRLFLLTFIYFVLSLTRKNRIILLWIATIAVAFIFGLGHLPAVSKLGSLTSFEIFRILLLNGIPGIIFGWLYWSKSFYTASLAHFTTDIVIHVIFV
jgi:hypothetical protein